MAHTHDSIRLRNMCDAFGVELLPRLESSARLSDGSHKQHQTGVQQWPLFGTHMFRAYQHHQEAFVCCIGLRS